MHTLLKVSFAQSNNDDENNSISFEETMNAQREEVSFTSALSPVIDDVDSREYGSIYGILVEEEKGR